MKKFIITAALVGSCGLISAQDVDNKDTINLGFDESAFTFTESQLGEDDDMTQNVTILNSNNNIFASQAGFAFGAVRYRFRSYDNKFNSVFINGILMNDAETGQFRYSAVGGINNITRNCEYALPFEANNFYMSGAAGSNNYDFRPSKVAAGNKLSLSYGNRNYTYRAMYTFATGITENGWALAGSATVRYAHEGYIEGTFYNSASYYLGAEKIINSRHSISLSTWGNPTRRAGQGAATEETYWLANSHYYNPYWGYQDGKVRNSRIVGDYAPSALATWDFNITENLMLSTSLFASYSMYSSTKLNYNGVSNPQPDYWKNLPSSFYNVWGSYGDDGRTYQNLADWNSSYDYWVADGQNRQIDWDALYYSNSQCNASGADAVYYVQNRHINRTTVAMASALKYVINNFSHLNFGINLSRTKSSHFQTMEDLLGAKYFHNVNTYAIGTYSSDNDSIQYNMLNPDALVGEGDKFGYDYNIFVNNYSAWAGYVANVGKVHAFVDGKINYQDYQREGLMRNGLAPWNSYGRGKKAKFVGGGLKAGGSLNLTHGHALGFGAGYEYVAPTANTIFAAPEVNHDFATSSGLAKLATFEAGYAYNSGRFKLNLTGYYSTLRNETDWACFYFDDINSFSYVSLTDIDKRYYGIEAGLKIKLCSFLDFQTIGTWGEAIYTSNANAKYMNSTKSTYMKDICYTDGMREDGTPLSALSGEFQYHAKGWFIELSANFYDRIYLSFSPSARYQSSLATQKAIDEKGNYIVPKQAEGKGGMMLDFSIGRNVYLGKNSLYVGLQLNNFLNNQNICSGGYEQSRSNYTVNSTTGELGNERTYKFTMNPKLYYALGINGMLNIVYKF